MFSKILVPMDGSDHSFKALEVAIEIAKRFGSKLTVLYVSSLSFIPLVAPETPFIASMPIVNPSEFIRLRDAESKAAEELLSRAEVMVREQGVEVGRMRREGHVVQEIVRAAKEGGYELIVMGTKGTSGIKELLLGSVAEGVVRHAPCSVLVVRLDRR
ncbi:MAG: universal stress protein [Candidatus Korarchaeum sp.]|nr:universal stress protein [Candidatus Korarchaeum sp.]MDW8035049.1 universal stress protein [Candidatus Korarchaeum sp.]